MYTQCLLPGWNRYLLFALFCCLASPTLAQNFTPTDEHGNPISIDTLVEGDFVKGRLLIKFKPGYLDSLELEKDVPEFSLTNPKLFKKPALLNKLSTLGTGKLKRVIAKLRPHHRTSLSRTGSEVAIPDLYNLLLLEVPLVVDIPKICKELAGLEGVEYAHPDYLLHPDDSPANDARYGLQRGFEQANDIDIDAARAWDFSTSNYTVKVGVVDSGIDFNNPDLGNGNFNFEGAKVRGGYDYFSNDANPDDEYTTSHGTAVAGIIGALRNNTQGIAGLAGGNNAGNIGCQLFALKVGGTSGNYLTSAIVSAITEGSIFTPTYGYGCHILNNSYGGTAYIQSLENAMAVAAQNNVVFVAAKGNDGSNTVRHYPADAANGQWVITVGATGSDDARVTGEDFIQSSFGLNIDVAAPGVFNLVNTTNRVENGT